MKKYIISIIIILIATSFNHVGCNKENEMLSEENTVDPIVELDFKNRFPHKYWLSDWSKDESYPNGFRYKILTARNEEDSWVEFVIVMEEPGGTKTIGERVEIKLESFDQRAKELIDFLEEELSIKFEEQKKT